MKLLEKKKVKSYERNRLFCFKTSRCNQNDFYEIDRFLIELYLFYDIEIMFKMSFTKLFIFLFYNGISKFDPKLPISYEDTKFLRKVCSIL